VRGVALLAVAAVLGSASVATAANFDGPIPRIHAILVQNEPIFGPEDRLDDVPVLPDMTFIFRAANFLHIDTKEEVIRREMLVTEGDLADPHLLEQSERNIRALAYVREVKISTVPAGGDEVDVIVRTRDTWTTQPRASFSSGGGTQRSSFGLIETNVLGYGKKIRLLYRSGIDRSSSIFEYVDPRILGSRWTAGGQYQYTSDGRIGEGFLQYPFFSFDTPWGGEADYATRREKDRIFDHFGNELSRFRREQEAFFANVGHRLAISDDEVVHRLGVFYRRVEDTFPDSAGADDSTLIPINRRQSEPGLFYHREEIRFVKEKHFKVFDRVEDLNLGNVFDAEVGYSSKALDALVDEPIATFSDRQGFDFGPGRKAFVHGLLTGRHDDGDLRNAVLELEGISYTRLNWSVEHTLVSHLKLDLGRNLDRDTQLILGNDNGLRGFDTRQFVGEKRFVFNLEDRVFFVNDLFHLLSLGAVAFFDSGYVWERNQGVDFRRLATSIGIGLRVDALRAAGEALFRLDLAFPLTDGGSGQHGPAVSIGAGQAFDAFSGPFDLQTATGR
jgi:surface antigen Omp85-like protein/surface antigen-like variable number repeat protein